MKIAIFGDSYADEKPLDKNFQGTDFKGWVTKLRRQGHTIENFASSGSSLVYSYIKFLNNKDNGYDKIIFLHTHSSRIYLPEHTKEILNFTKTDVDYHFNTGLAELYSREDNSMRTNMQKDALDGLIKYYQYVYNEDVEHVFHSLMLKHVSTFSSSNMLILPSFKDEFFDLAQNNPNCDIGNTDINFSLCDISGIDYTHYGITSFKADKRFNHMNDANNEIFASIINAWIVSSTFDANINVFSVDDRGAEILFET